MIDHKIIEECRAGNFNNFGKLVAETSPYAFSLAFRLLGDTELAKDVVQDTLVILWQKLPEIKAAGVYNAWLRKIVVNKCYDHLRRRKRNPEVRADDRTWFILSEKTGQIPSDGLENDEIAGIIRKLTDKLSPKQKTIFILSELEEMTSDEINEITGINKTVIKSNLYHARKHISELISKHL